MNATTNAKRGVLWAPVYSRATRSAASGPMTGTVIHLVRSASMVPTCVPNHASTTGKATRCGSGSDGTGAVIRSAQLAVVSVHTVRSAESSGTPTSKTTNVRYAASAAALHEGARPERCAPQQHVDRHGEDRTTDPEHQGVVGVEQRVERDDGEDAEDRQRDDVQTNRPPRPGSFQPAHQNLTFQFRAKSALVEATRPTIPRM